MLSQITTTSFRNLKEQTLYPASGINFVLGDNGSGKTSLLEAINLIATGRSFRSRSLRHLIQFDKSSFIVFAKNDEQLPIGFQFEPTSGAQFKLNGDPVKRLSDVASFFPLQFIPADCHQFFINGPKYRRQILDWGVFHVKHDFNFNWQSYKKSVQQRNSALRKKLADNQIQLWDEHITNYGKVITDARQEYLKQLLDNFTPTFKFLCEEFAESSLTVRFNQGWQKNSLLNESLSQNLERDKLLGYTKQGAHSADWSIRIDDADAKEWLSRGQQKLYFLSLRIAQLMMLQSKKSPVLLIDDISSELDISKQQAVISLLQGLKTQIFITSTNLELSDFAINKDKVFHVKHGEIVESDS